MSRKKKKQIEKEAQAENGAAAAEEMAQETSEDAVSGEASDQGQASEAENLEDQEILAETPEEILTRERDEFKEKWLRVVAELDNVRKRSSRQLVDGRRFAQAEVLRSFLDVSDNFERALQSMGGETDTETTKSLREGIELVYQNFRRVLKDQGVEPIEALEAEFDPALHEAVGQFEREGVEPGHVIEVVQQGFKLGDMVLRPSRVIISA